MFFVTYLHSVLSYDAEIGVLRWRPGRPKAKIKPGERAGWLNKHNGYRYIPIFGKHYKETFIIWAMMLGRPPDGDVDHKNGTRDDNRWSNLREVTRSQNNANTGLRKDNTSGIRGVSWVTSRQKWKASVTFNGIDYNLGMYASKNLAAAVRERKARELFGEFYREDN